MSQLHFGPLHETFFNIAANQRWRYNRHTINWICLITNDHNQKNYATIYTMIEHNQGTWNSSSSLFLRDFEAKSGPRKLCRPWGSNPRPYAPLFFSVTLDDCPLCSNHPRAPIASTTANVRQGRSQNADRRFKDASTARGKAPWCQGIGHQKLIRTPQLMPESILTGMQSLITTSWTSWCCFKIPTTSTGTPRSLLGTLLLGSGSRSWHLYNTRLKKVSLLQVGWQNWVESEKMR